MTQALDTARYLADILPQAQKQRRAAYGAKLSFYEQVKSDISWRSMSSADYERILRAVCAAMDF